MLVWVLESLALSGNQLLQNSGCCLRPLALNTFPALQNFSAVFLSGSLIALPASYSPVIFVFPSFCLDCSLNCSVASDCCQDFRHQLLLRQHQVGRVHEGSPGYIRRLCLGTWYIQDCLGAGILSCQGRIPVGEWDSRQNPMGSIVWMQVYGYSWSVVLISPQAGSSLPGPLSLLFLQPSNGFGCLPWRAILSLLRNQMRSYYKQLVQEPSFGDQKLLGAQRLRSRSTWEYGQHVGTSCTSGLMSVVLVQLPSTRQLLLYTAVGFVHCCLSLLLSHLQLSLHQSVELIFRSNIGTLE